MSKRKLDNRTRKLLNVLNAEETINSGATFSDNDGVIRVCVGDYNNISVEIKTTDNKSFSVSETLWKKISHEARRINKMPLLAVDIQDKVSLVVMDVNDFMSMLSFIEVLLNNNETKISKE